MTRTRLSSRLLFLFLIFSASKIFAEPSPVVLTDATQKVRPGALLEILEDPSRKLTLNDVRNLDAKFRSAGPHIPGPGFTTSAYWARMRIKNDSNQEQWILQLDFPLADDYRIFVLNAGQLQDTFEEGIKFPHLKRNEPHRTFLYRLSMRRGSAITVYVRLEATASLRIPLILWRPSTFSIADQELSVLQGAYFGVVIVMILYNLFIFISVRDTMYVYYVLCAFLVGVFFAIQSGYAFLIFPEPGYEWVKLNRILIPLYNLNLCLFVREFLNLKHTAPRMNRMIQGLMLLTVAVLSTGLLVKYQTFGGPIAFLTLLVAVFALIAGIMLAAQGLKQARFFIMAWFVILLGLMASGLRAMGWFPVNWYSVYLLQLGSALELTLLSVALADRINLLKLERERAVIDLEKTNVKLRGEITLRQDVERQTLELLKQQKTLAAHLQVVGERERRTISSDVHDEFGGALTSLKISLTLLERKIRESRPSQILLQETESMKNLISQTIQSVRELVRRLRPEALNLGLLEGLKWLFQEWESRTGIQVNLVTDLESLPFDEECAIAIFRIVQESLTNIARHANANRVDVRICKIDSQFLFEVADNGTGVNGAAKTGGFGILGMKDRALVFDGSVDVIGIPGKGTTVTIKAPFTKEDQKLSFRPEF